MSAVPLHEAQATLPDLIHRLRPDESVQITENGHPVAVVTRVSRSVDVAQPRKLGTQAGSVLYVAADFDAPLDELKEYME